MRAPSADDARRPHDRRRRRRARTRCAPRDGARAVLKFATGPHLDFEQAAANVRSPARRAVIPRRRRCVPGCSATPASRVIELLPGEPAAQLAPAHVERVDPARRAATRRSASRGRPPWIDDIVTSVDGGPRRLLRARGAWRTLLARRRARAARSPVRRSPSPHATSKCRPTMWCTWISRPHNMLVDGDRDHGRDRLGGQHDRRRGVRPRHARLAIRSTPGSATRCSTRRVPAPTSAALPLYAAHMTLRQADWSIRFHDPAAVRGRSAIGTALLDGRRGSVGSGR